MSRSGSAIRQVVQIAAIPTNVNPRNTVASVPSLFQPPDRVDRGQARGGRAPSVALIVRDPQAAGCRSNNEVVAAGADIEAVTVDEVVSGFARQAFIECLEAAAAVARSRYHKPPVNGNALLVFDAGHEPRGVAIRRVDGDSKPER